ncbi:MAG TPA: zinc ribbon domain-containing protein [Melioribacteraceae bacterium]|nr:zinc ribbon domain-containing protein [Melioribacteraceae bacterium]
MPTYEYKCNDCGVVFEKLQKFTEEPIKVCPECGGAVKRLIGSGAGLIFKGTGFYITDYKKNESTKKSTTTTSTSPNIAATETNTNTSATKTETKATAEK